MHFWTDSEIVFKGWRDRRYQSKTNAGSNDDLWELIGKELKLRVDDGPAHIAVYHVNSHLT